MRWAPEDAAAAADAEKWRVVRGSGFVYTEMPQEELARRRMWVLGVPLFSGLDEVDLVKGTGRRYTRKKKLKEELKKKRPRRKRKKRRE